MSSPRRSTADVLAAMNAKPAGAPTVSIVPTEPSPARVSSKPAGTVRFTFDVTREQHRFIKHYVLDADTTASAATRTLWELVAEDNALAQRLHSRLEAQRLAKP